MTNAELRHAFALKLDGKDYDEIGKLMSYSPENVRNNLYDVLSGKRKVKKVVSKNRPRLAAHINKHYDGITTRFADRCGISYSAVKEALKGRGSKETLEKISAFAGKNVL